MPPDEEEVSAVESAFENILGAGADEGDGEPFVDPDEADEATSDDDENADADEAAEEELAEELPDPPEPSNVIKLGDKEISPEQAQQLLQLEELIASDPNFAQHLYNYFNPVPAQPAPTQPTQGQPVATQPATPWTEPPAEYLENPAFKSLYDINKSQWEVIQNLRDTLEVFNNDRAERQRLELESTATEVASTFASTYKLNDDELKALRIEAAKIGIVPSLIQQGSSARDAFTKALEMAYWANPEYRTRDLAQNIEQQNAAKKRKAKAAAVSGSSGSAPRSAPKPQNENERRQAMIDALAQGWSN